MSSITTSPSKKLFTNHTKAAIDASNTHRHPVVPEDLTQALENLGMRVRKSVTEGYLTDRVFTVPPTPNSSPAKSPSMPTPIFQSTNAAIPHTPVTPSPRKRSRAEVEVSEPDKGRRDAEMEMEEDGTGSDYDPFLELFPRDENATSPRKIKSLRGWRGTAHSNSTFADRSASSSIDTPSLFAPSIEESMSND